MSLIATRLLCLVQVALEGPSLEAVWYFVLTPPWLSDPFCEHGGQGGPWVIPAKS